MSWGEAVSKLFDRLRMWQIGFVLCCAGAITWFGADIAPTMFGSVEGANRVREFAAPGTIVGLSLLILTGGAALVRAVAVSWRRKKEVDEILAGIRLTASEVRRHTAAVALPCGGESSALSVY